MNLSNTFKLITARHGELLEIYQGMSRMIATFTNQGCIDATEYWRDEKYLYLVYPMTAGQRKKKYVGSHPERIKEARQKLQNFRCRFDVIHAQEKVSADLADIEERVMLLGFAGYSYSSARNDLDTALYGLKKEAACG